MVYWRFEVDLISYSVGDQFFRSLGQKCSSPDFFYPSRPFAVLYHYNSKMAFSWLRRSFKNAVDTYLSTDQSLFSEDAKLIKKRKNFRIINSQNKMYIAVGKKTVCEYVTNTKPKLTIAMNIDNTISNAWKDSKRTPNYSFCKTFTKCPLWNYIWIGQAHMSITRNCGPWTKGRDLFALHCQTSAVLCEATLDILLFESKKPLMIQKTICHTVRNAWKHEKL